MAAHPPKKAVGDTVGEIVGEVVGLTVGEMMATLGGQCVRARACVCGWRTSGTQRSA